MKNSIEILDALGIDTSRISEDLIKVGKIRKFPIQDFTEEKIKNAILSSVEVELEEVENERAGKRITIGTNNFRIKNVKRNPKYLLFALFSSIKADPDLSITGITGIIFLLHYIFKAVRISLSSDEAFVFWHIFRSSENEPITDNNLVDSIKKAITDDSYSVLSEDKIHDVIKSLIQKDLLKIEDGNYDVTDRNTLPWHK